MRPVFDYTTILAHLQGYPTLRIAYGDDETGWARRLDATHVLIANLPCTGGLCLHDIVTLQGGDAAFPTIDRVVQRYYAQQCCVAYVPEEGRTDATYCAAQYARLREVCLVAGCAAEGLVAGIALVNAPDGVDVRALLAPLGIIGEAIDVYVSEEGRP